MTLSAIILAAVLLSGISAEAEVPETVQFNRDVLPILSDHCFKCHGPDERQRETKQRFDTREGIERAVSKGFLVSGKPDESELIERLTTADEDEVMPPLSEKARPSPHEISILRRWSQTRRYNNLRLSGYCLVTFVTHSKRRFER